MVCNLLSLFYKHATHRNVRQKQSENAYRNNFQLFVIGRCCILPKSTVQSEFTLRQRV